MSKTREPFACRHGFYIVNPSTDGSHAKCRAWGNPNASPQGQKMRPRTQVSERRASPNGGLAKVRRCRVTTVLGLGIALWLSAIPSVLQANPQPPQRYVLGLNQELADLLTV